MTQMEPDDEMELDESEVPPTYERLLLEAGLYEEFALSGRDYHYIEKMFRGQELQFDAHCVYCKQSSTFKQVRELSRNVVGPVTPSEEIVGPLMAKANAWLADRSWSMVFNCLRNNDHSYVFIMQVSRRVISKIGQSPSVATIATADINQFRSVLDERYFKELKRAVGLSAHGVGVGSFVYLRRIFEHLINEQRDAARCEGKLLEGFEQSRIEEKIEAIRDRLPPTLVSLKAAYPILSAGIHELDEQTCQRYFPLVKNGIMLILHDHLEIKKRKKIEGEIKHLLGTINSEIEKNQGKHQNARTRRKQQEKKEI